MSQDSLMGKFEALMRKHRGGAEAPAAPHVPTERQAPSPDTWLPVLTDIVQRGSPTAAVEGQPPAATAMSAQEPVATEQAVAPPMTEPAPETSVVVEASPEPAIVSETVLPQEPAPETGAENQNAELSANLLDELAPKITGLMQEQVAEELRKSLSQSMASLMANLNANVEEIVRQAVAEKLAGRDKGPK